MILDKRLMFSENQAITATAVSTNSLTFEVDDLGTGEPVTLWTQVTEAFAAAGDASLQINLQHSDDGSTWKDLVPSRAFALSELGLGANPLKINVPAGAKKHMRLNYPVADGPMTAGKITAGLKR